MRETVIVGYKMERTMAMKVSPGRRAPGYRHQRRKQVVNLGTLGAWKHLTCSSVDNVK